ncbi:hypothetical protein VTN00DRAFT_2406 [Thermoascus crustaceus]|uniref:uncharacterized protein n=1 Tax=Thermoascus crustaceus TaxID=5088 RepID=UPI003741FEC4
MSSQEKKVSENETEQGVVELGYAAPIPKKQPGGIALVPQPSEDPKDPLNWPQRKKYTILAVLCLSAFSGLASSLVNQLGFVAQARLYHKSLVEVSYSISAAVAGLAGGPLLLVPLSHVFGRSALIWWSLIGFAGPTFGGFIVEHVSWQNEFWWTVGLQCLVIVLGFFFLEETGFTRPGEKDYPPRPDAFLANRIATFFPGNKVAPRTSSSQVATYAAAPFLIGLSPVAVCTGTFTLVFFGWFVSVNTLLTVFLQEPEEEGGYAFTPQQNAAFTFSLWMGIICAQVWGYMLNDRIPIAIAHRKQGVWKPEYRLHSLWIPSVVIMPAGLGIFGATLQYHLHYMALALGSFMITFAAMVSIPIAINYIAECFRGHATEVGGIMGLYRLGLGVAVPFFIESWLEAVNGPGWVFGMAAFLTLLVFLLIILLMWKGHSMRQVGFGLLTNDEDGVNVVGTQDS